MTSFTTALGWTPTYQIAFNGNDITGQFNDRTIVIRIASNQGGGDADTLDISLDDRDFAIAEVATEGEGQATLDVFLGYKENALYAQGSFQIVEAVYEGPPKTMRLRGNSTGFNSNIKAPIVQSFDGKTLGDVLADIATSAGASVSVDPSLASQKIPYLNQTSSPMHLLQEFERRYNGLAKFQDGVLSFTQRGSGNSASGQFLGGFELTPEDFGVWSICQKSRSSYSKVRVPWRDKTQQQLQWLENTNKAGGSSTVPFLMKRAFNSQDEAQAAANAKMDALNRGILTGSITLAKGDPSIRGGSPFIISGMRTPINGSWMVQSATHTFTKTEGITTTLDVYYVGENSDFSAQIGSDGLIDTSGLPGNI